MNTYHRQNSKSTKSTGVRARHSAAHPAPLPDFAEFAASRIYPPIRVTQQIHPAAFAYFALPRPLYEHPAADAALEIVAEHAENFVDPRWLYQDNDDWIRRCSRILQACDGFFCLTYPDGTLAAGAHAEAAYAHALGIPVHVVTWTLDSEPRLRLGGQIVTLKDWHWWRAAIYRPKGWRTGWLARVCRPLLEAAHG